MTQIMRWILFENNQKGGANLLHELRLMFNLSIKCRPEISLNSRKTDITQVMAASGDWEVDKTILSGATVPPGLGNMVKN